MKRAILLFPKRKSLAVPAALIFIVSAAFNVQAAEPAEGIRQIALGERHACAVTFRGELLCWGENRNGQIGDGSAGGKRYPTQVFASGATSVSAGYAHTCAVVNGGLQCWGWNQIGQVNGTPGDNILKPTQIIENGVTAVAAGGMHTCAVVRGAALCWGANGRSFGNRNGVTGASLNATQVIASGVTAISARAQSTCAIVNGALQCWGDNRFGPTNNERSVDYARPIEMIASGVTAVAVGGSGGNSCAVVGGALQCWGKKYDVASSPPGSVVVTNPTQVIPEGVTAVAVSGMSGCAVVQGALQCWGYNSMGDLGAGGGSPRIVPNPTQVIASGVTAVSMGEGYTCALVDGALRCRGYNGYGAMSSTIAMDKIADSRPFSMGEGDVRVISHAAADAIAAMDKMPGEIAGYLQGKLIAHDNAVYSVRRARGYFISRDTERMGFDLDVTPLYPTTSAVDGDMGRNTVIPADAECGGRGLPIRLSTSEIGVQKENGFVDLKAALKNVFHDLPPLIDGDRNINLRFSADDFRKIESCEKAINDLWDSGPIKAITLSSSQDVIEIPRTLSRSWSVPGEGLHTTDLIFVVEAKSGRPADFVVEAQRVSAMRCGEIVLSRWKRDLSAPWKLHATTGGAVGYFSVDEDNVRAVDAPTFPDYSQNELRRAINVERGREGLASIEEARSCVPMIEGYRYRIRNQSNIVQEVFNPGFKAIPDRGCDQELPTLALRAADKLGHLRGKQIHTAICKAWPGDPAKSIVALVWPQDGTTDEEGSYDLDVLIVKTKSGELLQHVTQKGAIASDAMHFDGIWLDTANYELAHGVRAFGVRTRHSHMGGTSSSDETLSLYVPRGNELKPVLLDLNMNSSVGDRGGECNEARATVRTLAIGSASSHGYAHLVVAENNTNQEIKTLKDGCEETVSQSSHRYVLQFDGTKYVAPKEVQ